MASYLIKKSNDNKSIICMEYELDGYKLEPKNKENNGIHIKEITIINKSMIDKVLTKRFIKNYEKLFKAVSSVVTDENPSDDDVRRCLSEIERLKSIIDNKYNRFLSIQKYKYFMNELYMLNETVNKKIIMMNLKRTFTIPDYEYEEEMHVRM